jgi:hypothetical protein
MATDHPRGQPDPDSDHGPHHGCIIPSTHQLYYARYYGLSQDAETHPSQEVSSISHAHQPYGTHYPPSLAFGINAPRYLPDDAPTFSIGGAVPASQSPSFESELVHMPRDPTARQMKTMMRVFPIPLQLYQIAHNPEVEPRVFVHQLHRECLVEVSGEQEDLMPWLEDEDRQSASAVASGTHASFTRKKVHQCSRCRKWFDRPSALITHENAHSGDKRMSHS